MVGFALGGPLLALLGAAWTSYSCTQTPSDAGEAARGTGKSAIGFYNFFAKARVACVCVCVLIDSSQHPPFSHAPLLLSLCASGPYIQMNTKYSLVNKLSTSLGGLYGRFKRDVIPEDNVGAVNSAESALQGTIDVTARLAGDFNVPELVSSVKSARFRFSCGTAKGGREGLTSCPACVMV